MIEIRMTVTECTDEQLANLINFYGERVARYPAHKLFFQRYQMAIEEQARRIREQHNKQNTR